MNPDELIAVDLLTKRVKELVADRTQPLGYPALAQICGVKKKDLDNVFIRGDRMTYALQLRLSRVFAAMDNGIVRFRYANPETRRLAGWNPDTKNRRILKFLTAEEVRADDALKPKVYHVRIGNRLRITL
jgi:hypothetical protein